MTEPRKLRAPEINPESKPFWDAAAQGQLLVKRCTACGEAHYYPRTICPFCGSDATVWETCSGKGTIYTLSTMRRGPNAPFTLAYVTLDEGPSMMTNITDCDHDRLAIGQRVTVRFVPSTAPDGSAGAPYPMFTPSGD
ncbi:MAG TPA: OB-fold domain-containing protein [Polymorphobacter sp.]|nr:OB-fold domain-containing protein [Polymorphobacter sp.]